MGIKIQEFEIIGLHGMRDFRIIFEDNRLILVGENGSGKSTIVTIFYFFITEQWNRLKSYNYTSLRLKIDNNDYPFTKEDIDSMSVTQESAQSEDGLGFEDLVNMVQKRILDNVPDIVKEKKKKETKLKYNFLGNTKLFFLPTYRRIEQSLDSIYRLVDKRRRNYNFNETNFNFSKEFQKFFENKNFQELIEFGMDDIEKIIKLKEIELKESFRTSLNELTGNYLKDVIQKKYKKIDNSILQSKEFARLDPILDRIEEKILSDAEKKTLTQLVTKIQKESKIKNDEDQVIIHFLSQLVKIHSEQIEKEKNVNDFAKIITNHYLVDKEMVYDNKSFEIKVMHKTGDKSIPEKDKIVNLPLLSSGEKQIISLFSHLYLTNISSFLIIIDEPELSLSVPWQSKFLPDIIDTGKCDGLIAVTHSPFIYDNKLDQYAKEISEFRI